MPSLYFPESFVEMLNLWASLYGMSFCPNLASLSFTGSSGEKTGHSVQLMVIIVYKQVSNDVVKGMLAAKYHLRYTFHLLGKSHIALKVLPGFF